MSWVIGIALYLLVGMIIAKVGGDALHKEGQPFSTRAVFWVVLAWPFFFVGALFK